MEELQEVVVDEKEKLRSARKHFTIFGLVFLAGSVLYMGSQYAGAIIGMLAFPGWMTTMDRVMIVQMLPAYVIGVPLFLLLLKLVPKAELPRKKIKVSTFISFLPMIYAVTLLSNMVGMVINSFISDVTDYEMTNLVSDLLDQVSPLTIFILTVIMAPLVEEILFRKALVSRVASYGEGTAVALSGLMFALIHGNANQIPYAFCIGCVLGYIYLRTGNIWITIAMHAFTNLMGGVVAQKVASIDVDKMSQIMTGGDEALMMQYLTEHGGEIVFLAAYVIAMIAMVISGVIIFIVHARKVHFEKAPLQIPKGKRFVTVMLNPGMILFVAVGIWFIFQQT